MDVTLTRPRGQGVGYLDALVHPQLTLSPITSSMAAAQDVETPKILSNSCVNAISSDRDSDHFSSLGPPASQNVGRGCVDPLSCVPILAQEITFDSPQIAESQGNPSGLRVQVSGLYLNSDSSIPDKR